MMHCIKLLSVIGVGSMMLLAGCAGPAQPTAAPSTRQAQVSSPQLPSPLQQTQHVAPQKSLDNAIEAVTQQIVASLPADKNPLTAVLDFSDPAGNVSVLGRTVSEDLGVKLFQTRRVLLVERGLLDQALNELKFNLSAVVDPTRAKQLGKQAGADAIVTGTLTDMGSVVKINARMIDVEKGRILAMAGAEITKDQVIGTLMGQSLSSPGKALTATQPTAQAQKVAPANIPSPPPVSAKLPTYENDQYRITVNSVNKAGKTISVVMTFENLTDKTFDVSIVDGHLLDENGMLWKQKGRDTAGIWINKMSEGMLNPKTNLRTRVTFVTQESDQGTIFTLVGRELGPSRRRSVTINDLKAE